MNTLSATESIDLIAIAVGTAHQRELSVFQINIAFIGEMLEKAEIRQAISDSEKFSLMAAITEILNDGESKPKNESPDDNPQNRQGLKRGPLGSHTRQGYTTYKQTFLPFPEDNHSN